MARLKQLLETLPSHVTYVPADLEEECLLTLLGKLTAEGYNLRQRAAYVP